MKGQQTDKNRFLPPDAVCWRGFCYGDVAVCVSVTLMYCAQTTESIITRPSPDSSPAILGFPHQIRTRGKPLNGVSNGRGVGKSRQIRPINRSHSPEGSSGVRWLVCQRWTSCVTHVTFTCRIASTLAVNKEVYGVDAKAISATRPQENYRNSF